MNTLISSGKIIMLLCNISCATSAFYFDWNETHVKNPRWPPHARFHNGQTMSLGVMLGTISTYFLVRQSASLSDAKDHVTTAAVLGSMYWASGLTAIFYPGTDWCDPEFKHYYRASQKPVFTIYLAAIWVGHLLEKMRLDGLH